MGGNAGSLPQAYSSGPGLARGAWKSGIAHKDSFRVSEAGQSVSLDPAGGKLQSDVVSSEVRLQNYLMYEKGYRAGYERAAGEESRGRWLNIHASSRPPSGTDSENGVIINDGMGWPVSDVYAPFAAHTEVGWQATGGEGTSCTAVAEMPRAASEAGSNRVRGASDRAESISSGDSFDRIGDESIRSIDSEGASIAAAGARNSFDSSIIGDWFWLP